VVHRQRWLRKVLIVVEAIVKMGLVWYCRGYVVYCSWCEGAPVVEVVGAALRICKRKESLRVGEVKRIGVGEEVADGLGLGIGQ
jgi:hypothetical protein